MRPSDVQLTQVLEPSLSQNGSKAVMIVTVAEDIGARDVTLQSLRFADSVANCKGSGTAATLTFD